MGTCSILNIDGDVDGRKFISGISYEIVPAVILTEIG